jgi:hypothetical protein
MRVKGLRKICIVFLVIGVYLSGTSLGEAQPVAEKHPNDFFSLQFVLTISWPAIDLEEPISPGETREVHLTISSTVVHGVFGKLLLRILKGTTFLIQLAIAEKSEWCTVLLSQEYLTGFINPDEVIEQNTLLYIHLNDDAPTNYTLGFVRIQGNAFDKKGPLNIFTLIHGYENTFTVTFFSDL